MLRKLIDVEEFIKSQCNMCDGACLNVDCDCINCKSDCRCDFIKALNEAPKFYNVIDIYPLTVIADRYTGTYSGGVYLAFNMDFYDLPEEIDGDDVTCSSFFENPTIIYGKGATPNDAVADLFQKMKGQKMSEHKYREAYDKGYADGRKKAFDGYVQMCFDELPYKEQIELLASRGADLSNVWFLCEKVMPPPFTSVLITIKQKYEWETEWQYDTDLALWDSANDRWEVTNDWDEGQGFEIIAWKPLPEPYTEGNE